MINNLTDPAIFAGGVAVEVLNEEEMNEVRAVAVQSVNVLRDRIPLIQNYINGVRVLLLISIPFLQFLSKSFSLIQMWYCLICFLGEQRSQSTKCHQPSQFHHPRSCVCCFTLIMIVQGNGIWAHSSLSFWILSSRWFFCFHFILSHPVNVFLLSL